MPQCENGRRIVSPLRRLPITRNAKPLPTFLRPTARGPENSFYLLRLRTTPAPTRQLILGLIDQLILGLIDHTENHQIGLTRHRLDWKAQRERRIKINHDRVSSYR